MENEILELLKTGEFSQEDDFIVVTKGSKKLKFKIDEDELHVEYEDGDEKDFFDDMKDYCEKLDDDVFTEALEIYSKEHSLTSPISEEEFYAFKDTVEEIVTKKIDGLRDKIFELAKILEL